MVGRPISHDASISHDGLRGVSYPFLRSEHQDSEHFAGEEVEITDDHSEPAQLQLIEIYG